MSVISERDIYIINQIQILEDTIRNLKDYLGSPLPKPLEKQINEKMIPFYGEKKIPNVWIMFTQKVAAALAAAGIATGAAPVSKQFASSLKDIKPVSEWTDSEIVEAWATWEKPEMSKMAARSAPAKPPRKALRETMTYEQLHDFSAKNIDGKMYGINPRGDMIDEDGNYVGHWDGSKIVRYEKPTNWERIRPTGGMQPNTAKINTYNNTRNKKNKPTWGIPNFGSSAMGGATRKKRRVPPPSPLNIP